VDLAFLVVGYVSLAPHELIQEGALLVHRGAWLSCRRLPREASWARRAASGHYLLIRRARGDVARRPACLAF